MLILSAADVRSLIGMPQAVEASADAYVSVALGEATIPVRHHIPIGDPFGSVSLVMSGFLPRSGALGVKVGSLFSQNVQRGLPATVCTMLLVSAVTGEAEVLMEATWLSSLRTGAGAGVATRWLAREDSEVLTVLGAGGMAYHQVEAVLAVRPGVRRVLLWNRTPERARRLASELGGIAGGRAAVEVVDSAEEAVGAADIVTASTSSSDPVVRGKWLKPGTHVNLIGAHGPDMREGDDELLRRSAVRAVDMLAAARVSGELRVPIETGVVPADAFVEIGAVGAERVPGRRSPDDITWFKSVGIAAQDLSTAALVHRLALERGCGTTVRL